MSSEDTYDPLAITQGADLRESYRAVIAQGGMAKNHLASPEWKWFDEVVLKSIEDEAFETLRKSSTDQERLKAQMMLLAADKPRQILKYLVQQGEAGKMQLESTHQTGG